MKLGYVLISVIVISLGLGWRPVHAWQDSSVQIRGPVGTDEVEHSQGNEVYGPVTRTDTLWRIATQVRPDTDVTLAQVMIALLHANPHAFLNNNPNALESGFMLRIPSEAEIRAIDPETARRQIDEGAPIARPTSSTQQQADNPATDSRQSQQSQAPSRQPPAVVQPVAGDDREQGGASTSIGSEAEAQTIDALQARLTRSIENTERVLAENAALRARLEDIAQTMEDIQQTMVAEDDFQQQIQQLLRDQSRPPASQVEEAAEPRLGNPWLLILLTFVPALLLITIATLVLRRKPSAPSPISPAAATQSESSPGAAQQSPELAAHDDFELDEAMAEFSDLDDEGDDLAALEDEMLVPVETENEGISLDDDLDDLNEFDLSEFDTLDDELDDEFTSSSERTTQQVASVNSVEGDEKESLGTAQHDSEEASAPLHQSELDALFASGDMRTDSANSTAAQRTLEARGREDAPLDAKDDGEQRVSDNEVFVTDESDEETDRALQELDDEEDFDFDRMVEQFADDDDDDLNDDDIDALLAKSDQLVGPTDVPQARTVATAAGAEDRAAEASEGNEASTPLIEDEVADAKEAVWQDSEAEHIDAESALDFSHDAHTNTAKKAGEAELDTASTTPPQRGVVDPADQRDDDTYLDIESILAEADAEPADDEDEPQSEESRRADAEDNLAAKLDLARAYLEMGEYDEARDTIEMVIDQASGELLREAKELLNRVDS